MTERYEVHEPDSQCGCPMQGFKRGGPHRIPDPIADRRQRAREAAQDSAQVVQSWAIGAIETGIEVATQVKITDDIIEAMRTAVDDWVWREDTESLARAAFRAAGFEVVE